MKKLLLLFVTLASINIALAQSQVFVGDTPLTEISVSYLIIIPYANLNFWSATVDYGQDCRGYNQVFQGKELRNQCSGLNNEDNTPFVLNSLAHLLNIFAQRGYELDRILPETDPDDVFDQWNAQYIFRKQTDE